MTKIFCWRTLPSAGQKLWRVCLLGSMFIASSASVARDAAGSSDAKFIPGSVLATLKTMGMEMRDPTPLNATRVQILFGVATTTERSEYDDASGKHFIYASTPTNIQEGPLPFIGYEVYTTGMTDTRSPNGGGVFWKVDSGQICLKRSDLEQVFGIAAKTRIVMTENESSYEFALRPHHIGDKYIYVHEIANCATRFGLITARELINRVN